MTEPGAQRTELAMITFLFGQNSVQYHSFCRRTNHKVDSTHSTHLLTNPKSERQNIDEILKRGENLESVGRKVSASAPPQLLWLLVLWLSFSHYGRRSHFSG